jgi:RND family efflux transporter MFP subunit
VSDQLSEQLAALRIHPARRARRGWLKRLIVVACTAAVAVALIKLGVLRRVMGMVFIPEVQTAVVAEMTPAESVVILTTSGFVSAETSSKVSSSIVGRVAKVRVREGERVEEGAPLLELFVEDERAAARAVQAEAQVARARAQAARANLEEVEQQLKRQQTLVEKGVKGRAVTEDLEARVKALEKNYEAARAEERAAGAQADSMRVKVKEGVIVAPIAGTITSKVPQIGELVGPQQGALFEIVDFDTLIVETDVPEKRLHELAVGTPCEVTLDAYPDKKFACRTIEIGKRVDRAKATIPVRVKFSGATEGVLPDMSAQVNFLSRVLGRAELEAAPKRILPNASMVERDGGKGVFVLEQGTLAFTPVVVGEPLGGGVELVEGPPAKARVVLHPTPELRHGQRASERK